MNELTLEQALNLAVYHHKDGNLKKAQYLYQKVLYVDPGQPDANHNFGILKSGNGMVDEAIAMFYFAVLSKPSQIQFWDSLLNALIFSERHMDAYLLVRGGDINIRINKFLEKKRVQIINKGNTIFSEIEQMDQHKGKYKSHLNLDATLNLIFRLKKFGLITFAKNVLIETESYACPKLFNDERWQQVKRDMLNGCNQYFKPSKLLLEALRKLYQSGKFELLYKFSLKLKDIYPDCTTLHDLCGTASLNMGKTDEALRCYKHAIELDKHCSTWHNNLGVVYRNRAEYELARDAYEQAIRLSPGYAIAYNNLGNIFKHTNDFESAKEHYLIAIDHDPSLAEAHRHLSEFISYDPENRHFNQMLDLERNGGLNHNQLCHIKFGLGKAFEDIGDVESAFQRYWEGNALRKEQLGYNIDQDIQLFEKLKLKQKKLKSIGIMPKRDSIVPIFIIGMPRSGTTLVEQILSNHKEITGCGELRFVEKLGLPLILKPDDIVSEDIELFRKNYLAAISKINEGKLVIVDKMPHNFRFIPLIMAAFPEAKIFHVKRSAAAVCWSNFKQYFSYQGLGYSCSFSDVVDYFMLYLDLMENWNKNYPHRIIEIDYEALTVDPETSIRNMIKASDLSWDQDCLMPHINDRTVRTASYKQVREKIYKGSSLAWKKYERLLHQTDDQNTIEKIQWLTDNSRL